MSQDAFYNFSLMVATTQLIVTFIFAILFHQEWKKQKRSENEQYLPFALTLLYVFLFLGSAMMIYSNFFAKGGILELLYRTQVYFMLIIGFIVVVSGILIFIAERIIRKNTRHLFFLYFIGLATTLITLKLLKIPIFLGFNLILLLPLLILLILFLYTLLWKTSGTIRRKMVLVTVGYGLFVIAIIQEIWFMLHEEIEVVSGLKNFILIASFLMGLGFYTIPSFSEFDWAQKIQYLYIINTLNGLCLFHQPFREGAVTDEDLLGGSLVAVQSLMKEMVKSREALKTIDHGDALFIFERSQHVIGIIIADEDLYIVHHKLQQLLKEFETLFGPSMDEWKGNLDYFYPLRPIIAKIFELKQEH